MNNTTITGYAAKEPGANLESFTYEVGELQTNEVEIDILYCGICHSDLSVRNNDWGISEFPFVGGS